MNVAPVGRGAANLWTSVGARRTLSVMRNSWPKLRPPPDPSKPNMMKIVAQMDNAREGLDASPASASGLGPDRRTLPRHLPESYLPASAGPPSSAAPLQAPLRATALRADVGASSGRAPSAPGTAPERQSQWRPPGWDAFQQQRGHGGAQGVQNTRRNVARGKAAWDGGQLGERPTLEVWGMRLIGALLVGIIGMHARDYFRGTPVTLQPPRMGFGEVKEVGRRS